MYQNHQTGKVGRISEAAREILIEKNDWRVGVPGMFLPFEIIHQNIEW